MWCQFIISHLFNLYFQCRRSHSPLARCSVKCRSDDNGPGWNWSSKSSICVKRDKKKIRIGTNYLSLFLSDSQSLIRDVWFVYYLHDYGYSFFSVLPCYIWQLIVECVNKKKKIICSVDRPAPGTCECLFLGVKWWVGKCGEKKRIFDHPSRYITRPVVLYPLYWNGANINNQFFYAFR